MPFTKDESLSQAELNFCSNIVHELSVGSYMGYLLILLRSPMHENHTDNESASETPSKRHVLVMALCCLLPIIVVTAVFALFPGLSYLSYLLVLLCPLSMLMMHLPQMLSKKKKTEKHEH